MAIKEIISKGIGFSPGSFAAFIRKGLSGAATTPNLFIPKVVFNSLNVIKKVVRR